MFGTTTFFTNVEDVIYSAVEYIPQVGTVYSVKLAGITWSEHDWKRHWQSLARFAEGAARDVVLIGDVVEPAEAVIFHTMTEPLTPKQLELYASTATPLIPIQASFDRNRGLLVVAGSTKETSQSAAKEIFGDRAKGLHQFHDSTFVGVLRHPKLAPNGEATTLHLPEGLYSGAPCSVLWTWSKDKAGVSGRPEATHGTLRFESGGPTRFGFASKKGSYDMAISVLGTNKVLVVVRPAFNVNGESMNMNMTRVKF